MKYDEYQFLQFERHDDGILLITINRPDVLNATNARLHWELSRVWKDIDEDPETNVVIITGKGRAFSAGGDLDMIDDDEGQSCRPVADDARGWRHRLQHHQLRESRDFSDQRRRGRRRPRGRLHGGYHDRLREHADYGRPSAFGRRGRRPCWSILWPLLCGMAKAKYYLLTADFIDGKEAERIGLVSLCAARQAHGQGLRGCAQNRARSAASGAADQARAQQLAEDLRAAFRCVSGVRDAGLLQRGFERGRQRSERKAPAAISTPQKIMTRWRAYSTTPSTPFTVALPEAARYHDPAGFMYPNVRL